MEFYRYRGDGYPPDGNEKNQYPYLAAQGESGREGEGLANVVNMAIDLDRPLLVKGPPGCGKTQLAYSVAHELGLKLFTWYVKSTSRARDGLYTVDVVRRLQDAQMRDKKAQDLMNYLKFGVLGEAFQSEKKCVVLIDEIDKADIDFPNDLLRELDEKKFKIEELGTEYEAKSFPIIIITSNDEKELPDAFLRRCLFYYIDFPAKEGLIEIVKVNTQKLLLDNVLEKEPDKKLVDKAVDHFIDFRKIQGVRKSPSTSELIDWILVLHYRNTEVKTLLKEKNLNKLPYKEALFKHQQDLQALERQFSKES